MRPLFPAGAKWPGMRLLAALVALSGCAGATTPLAPPPAAVVLPVGRDVGMEFRYVPPGSYTAGSPATEVGRGEDETQHAVTLSEGFYLGVTEVTQQQWRAVMEANPSYLWGERRPVEHVSWHDAARFCRTLSAKTGLSCRLPTEAQWEYACRAGGAKAFCFGDDEAELGAYAWYQGNTSERKTRPVGQKRPNAWGFHDMHGNVREWCLDWYAPHSRQSAVDPSGPASGTTRVLRGGSWGRVGSLCRSAKRDAAVPDSRAEYVGFRVVVEAGDGIKSLAGVSQRW